MSARFGRQKKRKMQNQINAISLENEVLSKASLSMKYSLRNAQEELRSTLSALDSIYQVLPENTIFKEPHTIGGMDSNIKGLDYHNRKSTPFSFSVNHSYGNRMDYETLGLMRAYITSNQEAFDKMVHFRVEFNDKTYAYAFPKDNLKYVSAEKLVDNVARELSKVILQQMKRSRL